MSEDHSEFVQGHRKREDLDYQPGTADEGGLSAHF